MTYSVGQSTGIELHGGALHNDDRINIVDSSVTCGATNAATQSTYATGTLAQGAQGSTSSDATSRVWSSLVFTKSQDFRVCLCLTADATGACDADAEFGIDLGTFTPTGVSG